MTAPTEREKRQAYWVDQIEGMQGRQGRLLVPLHHPVVRLQEVAGQAADADFSSGRARHVVSDFARWLHDAAPDLLEREGDEDSVWLRVSFADLRSLVILAHIHPAAALDEIIERLLTTDET